MSPVAAPVSALAVIVNPAAGGGRAGRALGDVRAALTRLQLEHRVQPARSLDHARELTRAAAAAGETVVAFGGDGLIGAVAGALCGSDGTLGVLPGGRGNDFVRALGIPRDPVQACEVLATGVVRALDLGEVDGRTFAGIASCGFDSVANRIANETTFVRGSLVYAYGALRALVGWRPASFTVTIDGGRPRTFSGYTVVVANSTSYGGGMLIAPDAVLTDGLLDVVIIAGMPRLRLLAMLPTVFRGAHVRLRNVHVLRGAEVQIDASSRFAVYADGDPISKLPATVRVLPGAVRTLVPQAG